MVPIEVAIQKLRGFIADQNAKIVKTNENELQLVVTDAHAGNNRRSTDRPVTFQIHLETISAAPRTIEFARASPPARMSKRVSKS